MPIGTAHMASLCLPGSELFVGTRWDDFPALARLLHDTARPAALLYPGEGAVDLLVSPPPQPLTLVVVDGTWSQARKVVRDNACLAALPRYCLTPPRGSDYRIRREPSENCVSTIEALMYALAALEDDPERFTALLEPFRAMVDRHLECRSRRPAPRERRDRGPRAAPVHDTLRRKFANIVCVVGEANAWPYRARDRQHHPDELVHWVAERPSTGERFSALATPRQPLAQSTPFHLELPRDAWLVAPPLAALLEQWRAFCRDGDLVCSWGHYGTRLLLQAGGTLPAERLDLRCIVRQMAHRRIGAMEEYLASIGLAEPPPALPGRAGRRLAALCALVRAVTDG
jgi:DTW domain-containing protein YfiP